MFIDLKMVIDIALKLSCLEIDRIHLTSKCCKIKGNASKKGSDLKGSSRSGRIKEATCISDNPSIEKTRSTYRKFKIQFLSKKCNQLTGRARLNIDPEQIPISIVIWMVVDLDQEITLCTALVIDAGSIGRITDNHQSSIIILIADSIHLSKPSQGRFIIASCQDPLLREVRTQEIPQAHLATNRIRIRILMTVDNNRVISLNFFKNFIHYVHTLPHFLCQF